MDKLIVKAEVESDFINSRGGVSAKGKPYEIHEQKVWVYLGSKFPKEININHDDPRNALKPGLYTVDLMPALEVGDFGRLGIDGRRLSFVPERPAAVAAKA
jgi:hypothetical protein